MASWSAILALTGFHYSGVTKELEFGNITGRYFWSDGYSYGTVEISKQSENRTIVLNVLNGKIDISKITINDIGSSKFKTVLSIQAGEVQSFTIK